MSEIIENTAVFGGPSPLSPPGAGEVPSSSDSAGTVSPVNVDVPLPSSKDGSGITQCSFSTETAGYVAMDVDGNDDSSVSGLVSREGNSYVVDTSATLKDLQSAVDRVTSDMSMLAIKIATLGSDSLSSNALQLRTAYQTKSRDLQMLVGTIESMKKVPVYGEQLRVASGRVSSSIVVPDNLPVFQWKGSEYLDNTARVFTDLSACLVKFQDIMNLYDMDFDKNYMRLLPS